MTDNERIAKRAVEIAEELRRALPPNTDFADGWQQRYLDRQNERYEKALEMARQEAAASASPCCTEQECEVPALCRETGGCERMEPVCSRGCPAKEVCKAIHSGGECTAGVTGVDGQSNSRESPMPTPDEQ